EVTASHEGKKVSIITPEPATLVIGSEETTIPEAPHNTHRPEVIGTPLIGEELTSKSGAWEPESPLTAKPVLTDRMYLCKAEREEGEAEEVEKEEEEEGVGASCHPVSENGTYTPEQPKGAKETLAERAKNSPVGKLVVVKETATNGGGS